MNENLENMKHNIEGFVAITHSPGFIMCENRQVLELILAENETIMQSLYWIMTQLSSEEES